MNHCPQCNALQPFESKILPCNVVICNDCVDKIYRLKGKVFGCKVCNVFHDMPKNGFKTYVPPVDQSTQLAVKIFEEIETQTKNSQTIGRNKLF